MDSNYLSLKRPGEIPLPLKRFISSLKGQPVLGAMVSRVFYVLGLGALQFSKYSLAIKLLYHSSRCRGAGVAANVALARCFEVKERWQEAAAAYMRALMIDNQRAVLHYKLGLVRSKMLEWGYAISSLRAALALDPSKPKWFETLGKCYELQSHYDEAAAVYREGLKVHAKNVGLYLKLAACHQKDSHQDKAEVVYLEALSQEINDPNCFYGLARFYQKEGELEKAVHFLEKALDLVPDNVDWHRSLGVVQLKLFNHQLAINSFTIALNIRPRDSKLWLLLASAQEYLEEWDSVVASLEMAKRLGVGSPDLEISLGHALTQLGKYQEAISAYRNAIRENPENRELCLCYQMLETLQGHLDFDLIRSELFVDSSHSAKRGKSTLLPLLRIMTELSTYNPLQTAYFRAILVKRLIGPESNIAPLKPEHYRSQCPPVPISPTSFAEFLALQHPLLISEQTEAYIAGLFDREFYLELKEDVLSLDLLLLEGIIRMPSFCGILVSSFPMKRWLQASFSLSESQITVLSKEQSKNLDLDEFSRDRSVLLKRLISFKEQSKALGQKPLAGDHSRPRILWAYTASGENSAYGITARRLAGLLKGFDHTRGLNGKNLNGSYDICIFFDLIVYKQSKDRIRSRFKILRIGGPGPMETFAGGDKTKLAQAFADFDVVVAVSPQLAEQASRYHNNVIFIPNGLELQRWQPSRLVSRESSDPFTVGMIAKLVSPFHKEQKGFFLARDVCKLAGAEFLVAGKGASEIKSSEMIEKFFSKIDLLIHPVGPDKEGCSNVIMESLALGVPVLTTRYAGLHPLILNNGVDAIISARNEVDFARYILNFIHDPALRSRLATNGRRVAESYHDITKISQAYRTTFLSLLLNDRSKEGLGGQKVNDSRGRPTQEVKAKSSDPMSSLTALKRRLEKGREDPESLIELVKALKNCDMWSAARTAIDRAVMLNPESLELRKEQKELSNLASVVDFEPSSPGLSGYTERYVSGKEAYFIRVYSGDRLKKWDYDRKSIELVARSVAIPDWLAFTKSFSDQRRGFIALKAVELPTISQAVQAGHFLYSSKQLQALSKAIARWHTVSPADFLLKQDSAYWQKRFERTSKYLAYLDPSLCDQMMVLVEKLIRRCDFADYVVTHGDLHPSNLMYNAEKNSLVFIDLEKISVRPLYMELAEFLYMFLGYRDDNALLRALKGASYKPELRPELLALKDNMPELFPPGLVLESCPQLIVNLALFALWKAIFVLDPDWSNPGNPDYRNRKRANIWQRYAYFRQQFEAIEKVIEMESVIPVCETLASRANYQIATQLLSASQ